MSGTDIRKNGSGYRDDTAFKAICNVTRAERKAKKHVGGTHFHRGIGSCNDSSVGSCDGNGSVNAGKLGR